MDWLWVVCFTVTAVFLIFAVKNILFPSGKSGFRIVEIALYLAGAAFLLYVPIFFLQYSLLTAFTADLINIMRVISLDAGYLDNVSFIEEHIGTGLFYRFYMAVLGVVHVAMPLVSVLALYRLLFRFYSNMMLRIVNLFGRRTFYVFSDINPGTVRLANNIRENEKKGCFIFAKASDEQKSAAEKLGNAIFHPDSIRNIQLYEKGKSEVYYFFLSEDEAANAAGALDLIGALSVLGEDAQKRRHIYVSNHSDDIESLLDSSKKGAIDVNLLRIEEVAVYRLLEKNPLYESAKDGVISVLAVGLDSIGAALVKTVSWCGQLSGCRLKINVAGIGITEDIARFKNSYPGLLDSDCMELHFYDCSDREELFRMIRENCRDTTFAVVAERNGKDTVETSIRLRREFLKMGGTYTNLPGIHAYIRGDDSATALDEMRTPGTAEENRVSYELDSFGSDEQIYTWENILDSDYELLAASVHRAYESIGCQAEFCPKGEQDRYNRSEVNKRASKAYALHIRYKLAQMGLDYVRNEETEETGFREALTEKMLEELTRTEHNRWKMFLLSEGWTEAGPEDVKAYKAAGLGENGYRCLLMKMHPFICPYEEMPARAEALGLADTFVSDRELVRLIPDILHDRWETSGVKYKIVRRKK